MTGWHPPYSWAVILKPASGPDAEFRHPSIDGNANRFGVSNFTVQITDANSLSAQRTLVITIYDWIEETKSSVVFSGLGITTMAPQQQWKREAVHGFRGAAVSPHGTQFPDRLRDEYSGSPTLLDGPCRYRRHLLP